MPARLLAPRTLDQLVWLGLDADTIKRLRPYVEMLPEPTPLNINTASAEVLAGVIAGLDLGSAKRIVEPAGPSRRCRTRAPTSRTKVHSIPSA